MINEFKEIYAYRQMIFSLVKKDLRGRYKGSVLGFMWTFVNPLLQLCVYTLVFSIIMRQNIEKYYLFLFVALIPWMFFSSALTSGSISIMIQKDMSGWGVSLYACLALPIIMVVEYIICLGIALLTSALTVYFRDLQYILGIIAMAWQYVTPVMYSSERVPEELLPLWNLNPMTPVIEAYRSVLYYKTFPDLNTLLSAFVLGIIVLVLGIIVFNKLEKGFAEEF